MSRPPATRAPLRTEAWLGPRSAFLADTGKTYLDTATKGIPPSASLEAMQGYYLELRRQEARSATEQTIAALGHLDDARRESAAFINASEDEIALVESTQQGIRLVADALRLAPGSRVVTSDVEFLATVLPWRSLATGARVDVLPGRHGQICMEDLEAALTSDTKVVCVSATQEVSGATLDLAALGHACRSRGVLSVVDVTQYLGPRMLDMETTEIDCVAVGGSKWLCNPFGLGFLCIRSPLLEKMRPNTYGYMALHLPPGGWSEFVSNAVPSTDVPPVFTDAARKFEGGGTGPSLTALTLQASLRELAAVGAAKVEERTEELTSALMAGLDHAGMQVVTPREHRNRAGIVTFSTGTTSRDTLLHDALLDNDVVVAYRKSGTTAGIRVAPYFYNTFEDVERCLEVVDTFAR